MCARLSFSLLFLQNNKWPTLIGHGNAGQTCIFSLSLSQHSEMCSCKRRRRRGPLVIQYFLRSSTNIKFFFRFFERPSQRLYISRISTGALHRNGSSPFYTRWGLSESIDCACGNHIFSKFSLFSSFGLLFFFVGALRLCQTGAILSEPGKDREYKGER